MIFLPVLNATLAVFFLLVLGGGLCHRKILRADSLPSFMSLYIHVLYPCLIFDKMGKTDILAHLHTMWLAPVIGFASLVGMLGLALAFSQLPAHWTGMRTPELRHTFAAAVATYNYGYLPIPILALLCPGNDEVMSLMFLFMIGVELAVWTCTVPCLAGGLQKGWWKNVLTAPFFAVLFSIGMNLTGGYAWIPTCVAQTITWIGMAYLSIPLITIGAMVYQEMRTIRQHVTRGLRRSVCWTFGFRALFFPPLMIFVATWFPDKPLLQQILLIQAAMPTAMMMVLFTRLYGGSNGLATWSVVLTNFLSPVTAVFWITLGSYCLGR